MMNWWMDLVFAVGLVILAWALYRMHRASTGELEQSGGTEIDLRESLKWLFPSRLIRQTGMLPQQVFAWYWVGKIILAVLLPLVIAELAGTISALFFILLFLVGFFSVDLWLLVSRQHRRQAISRSLGYFTDLIAALLQSGMNLSQAFMQASRYGLSGEHPLAREVNLVARELEAGGDRESAFNSLAERTGVKDLQRLAAVMNVGFRVGAPVADTLHEQSKLLRAKQWEQAESMVSRKALESLLPLLLVSLPLLLVLVFFPAGVQILQIFKLFSGAIG